MAIEPVLKPAWIGIPTATVKVLPRPVMPRHPATQWRGLWLEAVAASVPGPPLTLTDIGRRFAGSALLRHRIKRADRLLGNVRLQGEARSVYAALGRIALARLREPSQSFAGYPAPQRDQHSKRAGG